MIQIKNVTFTYGEGNRGVYDINCTIKSGECIVLCGKSGCGKTTVSRLINGLTPHFYPGLLKGEVLIDGKRVEDERLYDLSKKVGSVFQNPRSQFFCLDTTSELVFSLENHNIPKEEIEKRLKGCVEELGISDLLNRSITGLSGGEKQMIACGSIILNHPDVFVFDEPSSNLDYEGIYKLRNVIKKLKEAGKTIILTEHRLYYLDKLVDRYIYMDKGRIVKEYTAKEIHSLSKDDRGQMGIRTLSYEEIKSKTKDAFDIGKALEISGLHFAYKKHQVLNIDSFTIPFGKIIALTGENGAGKSTFARCLCGLEKSKGKFTINGVPCKEKDRIKKSYLVMQDTNYQLFTEAVVDEVTLGVSKDTIDEKKHLILMEELNLDDFKDDHPRALSGGQKQRVIIGNSMLCDKEVIILDEPTSGLDYNSMKKVAKLLKQVINKDVLMIVVTHDEEFINACCEYSLFLEDGKLAWKQ